MRMTASLIAYAAALLCLAGIFYNITALAMLLMGSGHAGLYDVRGFIIGAVICGIVGAITGELGDSLQRTK